MGVAATGGLQGLLASKFRKDKDDVIHERNEESSNTSKDKAASKRKKPTLAKLL